jgi:hypothetical protein
MITSNIQNLKFKDVSTGHYVGLAIDISLATYFYKKKYNALALLFGLFSIGSAGSMIETIQSP